MADFDLSSMARQMGIRRRMITFAPILPTSAQAGALAALSHRILGGWYGSRARIEEIYAAELARRLTRDAIDDLTSLFEELAGQTSRLILELTPEMRQFAIGLEAWHRGKWRRTVLAGTDLDVNALIGPGEAREAIETFLARNAALIRDISDQARGRISDAVFRGLQRERPPREVGREIAKALGLARQRANRIAADQSTKLASALDAERQRQAGLTLWKWRHSGKLHFRPEHKARNGLLYADLKADQGRGPNGEEILEPPEDLPGELPFCGCVRQGVLLLPM